MNIPTLKPTRQGTLLLSGALDLDSSPAVFRHSKTLLNSLPSPIRIDLSSVTRSDSSGVALLIAWQRFARKTNKTIQFLNLPITMQEIIRVSELEKVLSL